MLLFRVLTCVADVVITTASKYCYTSNHHSENSPETEKKIIMSHIMTTAKLKFSRLKNDTVLHFNIHTTDFTVSFKVVVSKYI